MSALFQCEAVITGKAFGDQQPTAYMLAEYQTISPVLALRWLCGQARSMADRLDPEGAPAWVQPTGRFLDVPGTDVPSQLRAWCEDPREQRAARDHLTSGSPVLVAASDSRDHYSLSIRPIRAPVPTHHVMAPADPRPGHASHRKTRRKAGWLVSFLL
ncbi:hypothetical protein ABT039_34810 [Streptomyces lasiicapitis]|uniref:hypothetical protein n=1 Tax=Streptomyces lasiicapitis TaxID=1923961 RepID=UPI003324DBCC